MRKIAVNVLALALFWLLGFALIRLTSGFLLPTAAPLIAAVLGVAIALRLRAFVAAVLLSGQVAFALSELGVHLAFGVAPRGGNVHIAIMAAATLGVVFGVLLMRSRGARPLPATTP